MKYTTLIFLLVLQSCVGFSKSFEGSWKGILDFKTLQLTFVLHLQDDGNGNFKASADSPDQGAYGLQASAITKGDSIFIKAQGGVEIKGRLINDTIIESIFTQNGAKIPFMLTKQKADIDLKAKRKPQEPIEPFSYVSKEVIFSNDYEKLNFSGTLTYPKEKGKYPAVILITGSGPQNRDEELFGHKPFKVIADYLTKKGIVVLRYDERGVGKSQGSFENSNIADFSKDAVAAFDFLKKQDMVDRNKLGIIGHSEGGLIATLLASQALPNLSYIVSLAGPAISIDSLMVEQLYAVGKSEGMSPLNLEIARKINKANFAVVKSNMDSQSAYAALLKNMGVVDQNKLNESTRKELLSLLAPSQRYFYRIETEQYLKNIYIPVFAAYGSLDIQVPSTINLKSLHDNLQSNSKTQLKEYEGLNHLFQKAETGRISEYAKIEETFNERVMSDISNWILKL